MVNSIGHIVYLDDEEEQCTISSNEELREAIRITKAAGKSLKIFDKSPPLSSAPVITLPVITLPSPPAPECKYGAALQSVMELELSDDIDMWKRYLEETDGDVEQAVGRFLRYYKCCALQSVMELELSDNIDMWKRYLEETGGDVHLAVSRFLRYHC